MIAEDELRQTVEKLRKVTGATVQAMAQTVEVRDPYTAGHQKRVSTLARAVATEMNLPPGMIEGIGMAGNIHDINKISMPAEILKNTSAKHCSGKLPLRYEKNCCSCLSSCLSFDGS